MRNRVDKEIVTLLEREAIQLYGENRDEIKAPAKENLLKLQVSVSDMNTLQYVIRDNND
ncbi:hypothetical protein WN55_01751 [Dufourea novaeangliae]|uniref:Uncharacterized protein n=1 Tax=Dufourea novaeangliae TaxID=178035 RepID=A0A154PFD3_DUFNO|nr:hypothetical protein WN55_01751 [Dufourea novaeangliae]